VTVQELVIVKLKKLALQIAMYRPDKQLWW